MISDYYVYALLDSSKPGKYKYDSYTFDYEPFYIGKGKSNRIKHTLYDKSSFKRNKILKLKRKNIDILSVKILKNISNNLAINKEIELISLIGRRDLKKGPLVNTTDGGDGRINSKHTDEIKLKISKNRKGKGIGWKHNHKTLLKMSENQSGKGNGFYGKTHTEYNKSKQSKRVSGLLHPMFGKKHTKETKSKLKTHRYLNISNDKIKKSCQKFNKENRIFKIIFIIFVIMNIEKGDFIKIKAYKKCNYKNKEYEVYSLSNTGKSLWIKDSRTNIKCRCGRCLKSINNKSGNVILHLNEVELYMKKKQKIRNQILKYLLK